MAANIDPRQTQISLEEMFNDAKRRIKDGEFSPEEIDILDSIFSEREFGELLPKTPEVFAEGSIDSLMSSVFGEEEPLAQGLPIDAVPTEPITPV